MGYLCNYSDVCPGYRRALLNERELGVWSGEAAGNLTWRGTTKQWKIHMLTRWESGRWLENEHGEVVFSGFSENPEISVKDAIQDGQQQMYSRG